MADAAIFDLTAETALTAAHEFIAQDTSAATRAQAATFALMGGLVYTAASVTTTNVTGVVGTLHALDLSGMDADRSLVLPDTARVGERIGVFVTVGDADFELDVITFATGSMVNGVNAGPGVGWSRLFISNEVVIFRCVKGNGSADTDWIVEVDGRIPCRARVDCNAGTEQTVNDVTWTQITAFTRDVYDRGNIADQANDAIKFRRSGLYLVNGTFIVNTSETNEARAGLFDENGFVTNAELVLSNKEYIVSGQNGAQAIGYFNITTQASMELWVRVDAAGATVAIQASSGTFMEVVEVLSL